MNSLNLEILISRNIVSPGNKELLNIYSQALELQELGYIDYITIRELVRITGYDMIEVHLLLLTMFLSLYDGSVCMSLNSDLFIQKLTLLCGDQAGKYAQRILLKIPGYHELIYTHETETLPFATETETYKPLVLVEQAPRKNLYFQKYFEYEQNLHKAISKRINQKNVYPDKAIVKNIIDELFNKRPIVKNEKVMKINNKQAISILLPLFQNLVIISGGPGTGKTSIIINLLRVFMKLGVPLEKITIAAPTGRASQKMTDSIHEGLDAIKDKDETDIQLASITGNTIHKLLRYRPGKNDFFYNECNHLKAEVIIIDEVSMVDVELLCKLLAAIDDDARIILIGDKDQLPSVNAGAILSCLVPGKEQVVYSNECAAFLQAILPEIGAIALAGTIIPFMDKIVILDESYRAEKQLQQIAEKIKHEDPEVINLFKTIPLDQDAFTRRLNEAGMYLIEQANSGTSTGKELANVFDWWAEYHFFRPKITESFYALVRQSTHYDLSDYSNVEVKSYIKNLFASLSETKILSPVRKGIGGSLWINDYYMNKLARRFDPTANNNLYAGLPIIITRNDYKNELYNGDIGIVLKNKNHEYNAIFNRPGGFISYPVEMLPTFEPAYCITVHKSQGSEYNSILLVFPDSLTKNLLTKEILYTGLTRAKSVVYVYAREEMLQEAACRSIARESGLRF